MELSQGGLRAQFRILRWWITAWVLTSAAPAWATLYEKANADLLACPGTTFKYGSPFTCANVCGKTFTCAAVDGSDTQSCTWGAYNGRINYAGVSNDQVFAAFLTRGASFNCTGNGGSIVASASAVGVQEHTISATYSRMEKRSKRSGPEISAGATGEVSATEAGSGVGFTVPGSYGTRAWDGDLDVRGNLIVGSGALNQFGVNVNPLYSRFLTGEEEDEDLRVIVGVSVPMQLVTNFAKDIDTSVSASIGVGALVGTSKRYGRHTVGGGLNVDLRYVSGLALPVLLTGRWTLETDIVPKLVAQPGIGFDLAGSIANATQGVLLLGVQLGHSILGYQGFFQSGVVTNGLAFSYDLSPTARAESPPPTHDSPQAPTENAPPEPAEPDAQTSPDGLRTTGW